MSKTCGEPGCEEAIGDASLKAVVRDRRRTLEMMRKLAAEPDAGALPLPPDVWALLAWSEIDLSNIGVAVGRRKRRGKP